MALARRNPTAADTLLVGEVEPPSLPAAPGSETQFRDIYLRIHDRALNNALRFLDYERAHDAVHDAIAAILKSWKDLYPEQRTDAYFYGAIDHSVLRELRRDRRFVDLKQAEEQLTRAAIEAIDSAPLEGEEIDVWQLVDSIIDSMPPRRRAVLLLIREHGMSYKQVAESLGIAEATVNRHLTMANDTLRAGITRAGFRLPGRSSTPALKPGTPEASHG